MKKRFLYILIAALAIASCVQKPDDTGESEQGTEQEVKPKAGTYTFVLPDFAAKTAWLPGDQISVRGNYVPGNVTVTLGSGDISSDGKTATVELSSIPSTFCPPDYLYAAYPAENLVFDGALCDVTTTFNGQGPFLVAYWEKDNSFKFKPAVAAVTFKLDASGYDAVVFGGQSREDIRYDYITADCTSEQETVATNKPLDGYPFIVLPVQADGRYCVFMPSRVQFKNGFSIYLKKGETYPLAYTYAELLTTKNGQVLDLGDITSALKPYDGMAPEEMKMPEITKRTEYKVNVEELSGICLTGDGKSLWGVGDQGQLAKITITDEGQVTVENVKNFSNDLEGVTRDPVTNTLYFCAEPNSVYKAESPFTSYTRMFKVAEAANYGNSGLEGIAWYKENTLYVGSQVGANLWRYSLTGEILDFISLKDVKTAVREVGGLCYDPVNDWLWVTDSEAHSLFVFSGDARTYYGKYKLSGNYNNESVCVDHERGCVWVGDDNDDQPLIIRLDMDGLNLNP